MSLYVQYLPPFTFGGVDGVATASTAATSLTACCRHCFRAVKVQDGGNKIRVRYSMVWFWGEKTCLRNRFYNSLTTSIDAHAFTNTMLSHLLWDPGEIDGRCGEISISKVVEAWKNQEETKTPLVMRTFLIRTHPENPQNQVKQKWQTVRCSKCDAVGTSSQNQRKRSLPQ